MAHPAGQCPVCNNPILENDDKVVCPECGAPYHRACYLQQGQCSFAEKHGSGFEYTVPKTVFAAAPEADSSAAGNSAAGTSPSDDIPDGNSTAENTAEPSSRQTTDGCLCPACGTLNEATGIFCQNCGLPLHAQASQANRAGGPQFTYASGISLSGELDGMPKTDWARLIGKNAHLYLYRFTQMAQLHRKATLTLSAFFFTPAYFAYRKMWGWAALTLVLSLLLMVPAIAYLAAAGGVTLIPGVSFHTLDVLSSVANLLTLAMRLLCTLYASHLYRKTCAKRLATLRKRYPDNNAYQQALTQKGGVSVLAVVGLYVITFAVYGLFYLWAGDVLLTMFAFSL